MLQEGGLARVGIFASYFSRLPKKDDLSLSVSGLRVYHSTYRGGKQYLCVSRS